MKSATLLVATGLIVGLCSVPHAVQRERSRQRFYVPPTDEAKQDPSLISVREKLLAALKARDAAGVLAAMDQPLKDRFAWLLTKPRSEWGQQDLNTWGDMASALELGGAFTTTRGAAKGRREFCAPYVYTGYPKPEPEDFRYEGHPWVVLGDHVVARAAADASAKSVGELSHDLIKVTTETDTNRPNPNWVQVVMPDGVLGWVPAKDIRDPETDHACFANLNGQWLMVQYMKSSPPW